MSLIDDIRKDREAGSDNIDAPAWSQITHEQYKANQRRRKRAPDMEAALLAMADAFAEADKAMEELGDPETALTILQTAYREAVK